MTKETANLDLGREAFVALAAKFTLAAAGFAGVVIFVWTLGIERAGQYYVLLAAAKLTVQVPGGVSTAIKKRVSEADTDPAEYLGLGLVVLVGVTAIVVAIVFAGKPLFVWYFDSLPNALGFVAIFASLGLFSLVNRFYAGIGYPGASFWTDTARSVLTLALQLYFLLWIGAGVLGLVAGFVGATVLVALGTLILAGVWPSVPSRRTYDHTAAFARWSVPNSLMQNTYMRLDVLLLNALVGSAAVGLYEPALRLTIPATFVAASIGDSLVVKASGLSSLGRDVLGDLKNALSYTALFAIPILFGALAMPTELMITVFSPEARAGWTALIGLALFQVFNTYRIPFDKILNGMDRPDLRFQVSLFTLAINVPLAVGLGYVYGLVGVVAATVIAELARVLAFLFVGYRLFDELLIAMPVLEQIASAVVMFVTVFALTETLLPVTSWVVLVANVGIGAVVYFGCLFVISSHFRLTARNVFDSVVSHPVQSS